MKITIELGGIDDVKKLSELLEKRLAIYFLDSESPAKSMTEVGETKKPNAGLPIVGLYLTVRSANCLNAENIRTIENLVTWSRWNLLKTPNLGLKSIKEIEDALGTLGLKLADRHEATCETTPWEAA